MNYQQQINRIKTKLPLAKAKDKNKIIFGAKNHKYIIKKPVSQDKVLSFEKKYGIQLPEDYKTFIIKIGNQGEKYSNSIVEDKPFAGPFYGIYPLNENNDDFVDEPKIYLQKECMLTDISDEEWKNKITKIRALPDEQYDKVVDELFAGILPIGSQGCNFYVGLILNGSQKGKVVYIDMDLHKPFFFTYEENFLDWYERWLDEIISGQLFNSGTFGRIMVGSENTLFSLLNNTKEPNEIIKILDAIVNLIQISEDNANSITTLINHSNRKIQKLALFILTKLEYEKAKPFLSEFILNPEDELSLIAVQSIYWYAKNKAVNYWAKLIAKRLKTITSEELLDFSFYVITETKYNYQKELLPLLTNKNAKIRRTAFYNLGKLNNKMKFEKPIKNSLETETNVDNLIQVLQSIKTLNNESFISYYKGLLKRVPNNKYLIPNIINLVEKLGIKHFDDEFQEHFKTYCDQEYNNMNLLNTLINFKKIKSKKLLIYCSTHQNKEIREKAKEYLEELL